MALKEPMDNQDLPESVQEYFPSLAQLVGQSVVSRHLPKEFVVNL